MGLLLPHKQTQSPYRPKFLKIRRIQKKREKKEIWLSQRIYVYSRHRNNNNKGYMKTEKIYDLRIGQVISERTYNDQGQLIETKNADGSSSKRTYNQQGDIIFDKGIGNKSLKPFWNRWERYYHKDGSREIYFRDSTGYWYEERFNKCGKLTDHVNSHLAKKKIVEFRGEEYLYGQVTPC